MLELLKEDVKVPSQWADRCHCAGTQHRVGTPHLRGTPHRGGCYDYYREICHNFLVPLSVVCFGSISWCAEGWVVLSNEFLPTHKGSTIWVLSVGGNSFINYFCIFLPHITSSERKGYRVYYRLLSAKETFLPECHLHSVVSTSEHGLIPS